MFLIPIAIVIILVTLCINLNKKTVKKQQPITSERLPVREHRGDDDTRSNLDRPYVPIEYFDPEQYNDVSNELYGKNFEQLEEAQKIYAKFIYDIQYDYV